MSTVNNLHSWLPSVVRGGRGMIAKTRARAAEPEQPLEIYEFEA